MLIICEPTTTYRPITPLQAQMEHLHEENPRLALAVEALIHRSLEQRDGEHAHRLTTIMHAVEIVTARRVELLHRRHHRVHTPGITPERIVSWYPPDHPTYPYHSTTCSCQAWVQGNMKYHHHIERKHSYAPFLAEIGVICKHVLAAWLYEAATPLWDCPDCTGQGFFMIEHPTDATGRPLYGRTQTHYCDPCTLCRGKGILFIDPDQLPPTGPAPQDPPPPPLDPEEIQALILDDEKRNLFCR